MTTEAGIVPLVTPFYNGRLDERGFLNVAGRVVWAGNGVLVLGKTGELESSLCRKKRESLM